MSWITTMYWSWNKSNSFVMRFSSNYTWRNITPCIIRLEEFYDNHVITIFSLKNLTFSNTCYRWISHRLIFISFKCLFSTLNTKTGKPTKNASTRRTGSTMWLDLPSSRFCLSPSLLNEQQERFFSIYRLPSGCSLSRSDQKFTDCGQLPADKTV